MIPGRGAKIPQAKNPKHKTSNSVKHSIKTLKMVHIEKKKNPNSQDRVVCWHKDRHLDQWNGTESSEINLYIYGQLIFNEGAENTVGRGWSLKQMVLGTLYIHRQKNDPRFLPHSIQNEDSKWIAAGRAGSIPDLRSHSQNKQTKIQ